MTVYIFSIIYKSLDFKLRDKNFAKKVGRADFSTKNSENAETGLQTSHFYWNQWWA